MSRKRGGGINKQIGARIRHRRIELKMSQSDLGDKFGVTFQQIQKYESGKNALSTGALAEFCEILNTSPNELLAWGDDHPNHLGYERLSAEQIKVAMNFSKLKSKVRTSLARAIRAIAEDT